MTVRRWVQGACAGGLLVGCNSLGLQAWERPRYDACLVQANAIECSSLGMSLVADADSARSATGWVLLRKSCELDEVHCGLAADELSRAVKPEYFDELAALACDRPGLTAHADRASCHEEYRARRDIAKVSRAYREIAAGHEDVGRRLFAELCDGGNAEGCKHLAAHEAHQKQLDDERRLSERRAAEMKAELEAYLAKPRSERAAMAARACSETGEARSCDSAAYFERGDDPDEEPAAFKRFRAGSRNPSCVSAYEAYRTQVVLPYIKGAIEACTRRPPVPPSSEGAFTVDLGLGAPFGKIKVLSCSTRFVQGQTTSSTVTSPVGDRLVSSTVTSQTSDHTESGCSLVEPETVDALIATFPDRIAEHCLSAQPGRPPALQPEAIPTFECVPTRARSAGGP